MKEKSDNYKTSDLNLAAFLYAKHKLKIEDLEDDPTDRSRVVFKFTISDDEFNIRKVVSDYFNHNDEVSASSYMTAISELRTWVRSHKMNQR